MPLTPAQLSMVRKWVEDRLLNTISPHSTLKLCGFPEGFIGALQLGDTAAGNARALMEAVSGRPKLQLVLLSALADVGHLTLEAGPGQLLTSFRAVLEDDLQVDAARDHFLTCSLKGGRQAFIDRQELRKTLRRFVGDPEMIVLCVDGEQGSGRSYTYELIRHLGPLQGFKPSRVILGPATTARWLLQELAYCVGDADAAKALWDEPKQSMDSAVQWVVRTAIGDQRHPWLILDQCDDLDQRSDVWDCIINLALTIYDKAIGESYQPRLVLLGYTEKKRQMPHEMRHSVASDKARVVEEKDLRIFFAQHFKEVLPGLADGTSVNESDIPGLVDLAVGEVLKRASGPTDDDRSYMRRVCDAVEGVIDAYR